jgi:anaerobic ribonucleoside-triphosphate reductase activating protein
MNYAKIRKCDVANGPGVRVSLFVSGCNHHCKNCFNKEAWDFNYGEKFTEEQEEQIIEDLKPDYITGLSVLGGEPFEQANQEKLAPLVEKVKQTYPDKKIWCYTGFTFDKQILGQMINEEDRDTTKQMLKNIDYIVDGKFVEELKDPKLQFRGSSNQRIIDVKKSLAENEIVLWDGLNKNLG